MKAEMEKNTDCNDAAWRNAMSGFSLTELTIVLVIVSILTAISLPYILNYTRLYKSEDQSLVIMDLMREASQLALTRRRTIRFEIDRTANRILIIDGKGPGFADDTEIKAIPIEPASEIRMDQIPMGATRPNPPNYNDVVFGNDTIGHLRGGTPVIGNTVWQIAFLRDGTAVNAANNASFSATLYVWAPLTPSNPAPRNIKEVRAITLFGGSGAVQYWKHNGTTFLAY